MNMPPLLPRDEILRRLQDIFPEGTPNRTHCTNNAAATAIYGCLYVGAIIGTNRWAGPARLVRMSDERALNLTSDEERLAYLRKPTAVGVQWYAENSREQLRDNSLRVSLQPLGAVVQRDDVAPNASSAGHALTKTFAALFDPALNGAALTDAINAWQVKNLTPAALSRVALLKAGANAGKEGVLVTLPNGETRRLETGPSSVIAKAVVESFAKTFLRDPVVLWISESGRKVSINDERLARQLGINIDPQRTLPDIILVDRGDAQESFLVVFVEIVASDGPMTEQRVKALRATAVESGFDADALAFVTAFRDREAAEFKKAFGILAADTFVWCASEPNLLTAIIDGERRPVKLETLAKRLNDASGSTTA